MSATANQLLSRDWSLGARYRFSLAELDRRLIDIPPNALDLSELPFAPERDEEARLHQVNLMVFYHHPCGFFSRVDALWTQQENDGYMPALPGDDFWQVNALVGYRFPRRRAEVRLGVLNLTDQDYRLNPLNLTQRLLRSRTLMTSLSFNF